MRSQASREQLAIAEYAQALLVIPKVRVAHRPGQASPFAYACACM
jgi:hypothetical protein